MAVTFDEVIKYLDTLDLKYDYDKEKGRILLISRDEDSTYAHFIRARDEGVIFEWQMQILDENKDNITIKEHKYLGKVLAHILYLNYQTKFGTWEFDPSDGDIRLAVEIPLEDATMTEKQFARIAGYMIKNGSSHAKEIKYILENGEAPESDDMDAADSFTTKTQGQNMTNTKYDLANSYYNQNRFDEAIKLYEESLKTLRTLYEENSERWAEVYTNSLTNLANSYKEKNAFWDAIQPEEESIKILRALHEDNPQRWAEVYTNSLNGLAVTYQETFTGSPDHIELYEESFEILSPLYKENPKRWVENYATSLYNLALSYYSEYRLDEAIKLYEESLDLQRALYKENPQRWAQPYRGSFSNLADSYKRQNRLDEALKLEEESLVIFKSPL